ncbi:Cellulosome-anchoring protein precursor [Paenibacillus konkukensis]|uniref:Intimin n=1 Tax=Paenibacillus konkukensis TaxID=2020716 RepID=A0ABY4RSG5_9BACL|nr:S-layer homology domain-containing protein [Paenibacillus konkukensis]UQZ85501.1 Cellulosome-anchoring protein precursor [Paenibacillus konkukensis]
MKRHTAKFMSWVVMVCMMITMMQPFALPAYAGESGKTVKWLTYKNDDFSNPNQIKLFSKNGDAKFIPDTKDNTRTMLRLTESKGNLFGTAFNKKLIAPGNHYSFSTMFKFRMNEGKNSNPADGITFTVQAQSNNAGKVGEGIGYGGIEPSFAVKYDTYQNPFPINDPSNNYIGLAVDGDVKNTDSSRYTTSLNGIKLADGNDHYSWIDYDGSAKNVKVYIGDTQTRPATPVLSVNEIDLDHIFQGKPGVYAGFTAATGGSMETHDILSWYFVNEHDPINISDSTIEYKQAPTNVVVEAVPTGEQGKYAVTTTLYDVDGNPVEGAPIALTSTDGTPVSGSLQSDENGQGTTIVDFGTNPPSGDITAVTVGGGYSTVTIKPAPTELSAGTTPQTATKLTWKAVSGASYYNVYKDGVLYATNVTQATYNASDLAPGEFAKFTVSAVMQSDDSIAESVPSNEIVLPVQTGIALDSEKYTLPIESTHQTVVSSVYSAVTKIDVTKYSSFSSSDDLVATVGPDGLVTAVGAGTTVIQAVYNGTPLTATVTVPIDAPTGVTATDVTSTSAKVGWNPVPGAQTYNIYDNGKLIASGVVGTSYQVTGLTPGTNHSFTVKAVSNNIVSDPSSPAGSVELPSLKNLLLDSTEYSLPVVAAHQTVVTSVYSDGKKYDVTGYSDYRSDNDQVAVIGPGGLVTAVGAGTTVIHAVYGGKQVTAAVTVTIGAPAAVTASDITSTGATVNWTTVPGAQTYNIYDNGKLVASGVTGTSYQVTGLAPGTEHSFTVKAVSNNIESAPSNASDAATTTLRDLLADPANYTLQTGATHAIQATAVNLDESVKDVTTKAQYSSSDNSVVTVDANGVVTAKAPGTATITVAYDGKTVVQTVTVQDKLPQYKLTLNSTPDSVVGDGKSPVQLQAAVVTTDGRPAAGVPVTFHFGSNTSNDVTVTTNENGIAVIDYTAPALQGLVPANEVITAVATDPASGLSTRQSIGITYLPAAVQGVVVDQVTGKPAAGSTVSVTADFNGDGIIDFTSTVTTGEDGSYSIGVPRGNFTYTMSIATPVQIGGQTVTLTKVQTATVGQLQAVGEQIASANQISGQLFLLNGASSDPISQTGIIDAFGAGNVSAIVEGLEGNNYQAEVALNADGSFNVSNVPQGRYKISYRIKAEDGTVLAGPSATVEVKQNGELSIGYSLIDPYGTVTDSVTGKALSDVTVNLYWADTELNRQSGRTPNTLVSLPVLEKFAPNQNHNPQQTDLTGNYAWMVYGEGDYYIVAVKPGYYNYSTLDAKPNVPAAEGTDSYIKDGIIHIGKDIMGLDFSMLMVRKSNNSSSGGGSSYVPATPNLSVNLSVDKSLVKEGDTATVTVDYKNNSSVSLDSGVITMTVPAGAKVVNAGGGTVSGDTITWNVTDVAAGQEGSFKVELEWGLLDAADKQYDIQAQFTANGDTSNAVTENSAVKIKVFSDRFGNLKHQRYILGYPDGKFHPESSLTRAELAAIVARLTENGKDTGALEYTDVQADHWAANYIKIATRHGYFSGFEDGSFRPEAKVSRGELAAVMARFLQLNVSAADQPHFTDLNGHWAADTIEALYRGKFLNGYTDGTFKPQESISRVEAVTMINRMLYRGPLKGLAPQFPDVAESHWGFGDVQEATVSHEAVRNSDGSETWKNKIDDQVE